MSAIPPVTGRLAPSPTGHMHLGNAWASLCAWLGVRSSGGRLILRIEDIDPLRSRPEYADALQEDLRWLGLDWDLGPGSETEGSGVGPFFQSGRLDLYEAALEYLKGLGLVYPCFCTRKELRDLAGAPHYENAAANVTEAFYPGVCRDLSGAEREERRLAGRARAWRLRFAEFSTPELRRISDLALGEMELAPEQAGGDFALQRSDGVFAYQLAVTVDDLLMGVNQVVRGADILGSTPRQRYLLGRLRGFAARRVADEPRPGGPGPVPWNPEYAHVPLLLDHEGERLAKRHAALSLRSLREDGVGPESALGYLAFLFGLRERPEPARAEELLDGFAFRRIRPVNVRLPSQAGPILRGLAQ